MCGYRKVVTGRWLQEGGYRALASFETVGGVRFAAATTVGSYSTVGSYVCVCDTHTHTRFLLYAVRDGVGSHPPRAPGVLMS